MARRAVARIDLGALRHNLRRLAGAASGAIVAPVVKADAYGHGMALTARALGSPWLCVATADEALALRRDAGHDGRIFVLGAISDAELPAALEARADLGAWDPAWVAALPGDVRVHVKLDTGLGRLGTRETAVADAACEAAGDRLAGVWTHFATADEPGDAFFGEQLARFAPWAAAWKARHPDVLRHCANSAALLRDPAAHLDLVRPGVAVYGLDPFGEDPAAHDLRPALKLVSWVATVKPCREGESAGYGRRFVAARDTVLATVPIGYGDGYRRAFTNTAEVRIGGRTFPVAGTVSMDNVTVDLGPDGGDVAVGDEVVLVGGGGPTSCEALASRIQTINYEITTALTARVRREAA